MKFLILIILTFASVAAQDSVRTFAGRALQTGAEDGLRTEARFNDPAALAADSSGNLYLADSRNHAIRRISTNGAVTTILTPGAMLDTPSGIAISPEGIIVSDTGNHVIRRINADGSTTLLAGAFGQAGFADGPAGAARFDTPLALAVSPTGIIYVADCGNHTIRAIALDGNVTTLAGAAGLWGTQDGQGSAARFNGPVGLVRDTDGNLFVSDSNNHLIRKINSAGEVTTVAGIPLENGFRDGDASQARFFHPAELALDSHKSLYIADSMNHAIRKISADGKVSTVAGFSKSYGAQDGDNGRARLYNPYGLAVLPSGELVFADSYNQTIRQALPPAELQISIHPAPSLKWNSVIGKQYQIQIATPLLDDWLNFSDPLTATDLTSSAPVPSPNATHVFRITVQP